VGYYDTGPCWSRNRLVFDSRPIKSEVSRWR
jgi:hypothetical protein